MTNYNIYIVNTCDFINEFWLISYKNSLMVVEDKKKQVLSSQSRCHSSFSNPLPFLKRQRELKEVIV